MSNQFQKLLSPVAKQKNQNRVRASNESDGVFISSPSSSTAGGIFVNYTMSHLSFRKSAPPPKLPQIQSHLWLFWSDFRERERESVCCPLELCKHLPSSEEEGWKEQGGAGAECIAGVCTVVQRDSRANRAATPAS